MNTEQKLKVYFETMAQEEEISFKEAVEITKSEWGEYAHRGYGIFFTPDIPQVEVIERIDDMDIYDGDTDAGEQALKDIKNGIVDFKIIPRNEYPSHIYPLNCYYIIDNQKNREMLYEYIRTRGDMPRWN